MSVARTVAALFATVAISLDASSGARAQDCERPAVIRYSMVPLRDAALDLRLHQPVFRRMTALTGLQVEVVRATSYRAVVEGLLRGAVDIAELGPATYIEATLGDHGITAFATMEKKEGLYQRRGAHYQAMLVVLKKRDFADIGSLKGASLALTDPGSTSGAQLPRKQFAAHVGMPLERYFGSVSYTGSHANSAQALASEEIDAAFIASAQLEEAHGTGKLLRSDVRILWESGPIPNDAVVLRGPLCASLKRQLEEVFLGDDAGSSLRDWLQAMNANRFVPVDDSLYAGIREVLESPPATR